MGSDYFGVRAMNTIAAKYLSGLTRPSQLKPSASSHGTFWGRPRLSNVAGSESLKPGVQDKAEISFDNQPGGLGLSREQAKSSMKVISRDDAQKSRPSVPRLLTQMEQEGDETKSFHHRLTPEELVSVQQQSRGKGTRVVTLVGKSSVHQVQVHGAKGAEFEQVQKSLKALAKRDEHCLATGQLKNVYLADSLGRSRNGHSSLQGLSFQEPSGENSIMLSRVTEQKLDSKLLEGPKYIRRLLYHELGHLLDNRYQLSAKGFGKGDFLTEYASVHAKEDFAETFAEFHMAATEPDMETANKEEVAQLLSFGASDSLKAKVEFMAKELKPSLEVQRYAVASLSASELNARELVQSFQTDSDFRKQWVSKFHEVNPEIPSIELERHFQSLSRLFAEKTT